MLRIPIKAVCLTIAFAFVQSKTSFVKDLRTDIPFPPTDTHTVAGIPEGHLRPLGWQKKPDGKVREEKDPINSPTFHLRYVKNTRPVTLRGLIKEAPVVELWEDDNYLRDKYGKLNITITVKKEIINRSPERTKRRMLFKKFLLDYKYENWYLSSTLASEMMPELPLPSILTCGSYKDRLTEAELWMSSGGTSSLLHSHGDHNLHCVLDGRKDFILIDPEYKDVFKFQETYPNSGSGQSSMDMDMINAYKFPKIGQTPWTWSTLWQGDCIYVPAGYLHQVRSYGRGISYTIQFAPVKDYDSSDCKEETKSKRKKKEKKEENEAEEKKLSLADVDFLWTYSDGEGRLKETQLTPSSLRRILLILIRDGEQLHQTQFQHFFEEALANDEAKPPPVQVFHIMTPNDNRNYISRDEIHAISDSRLQNICDIFNKKTQRLRDEL